jgi:hypothetical protein
MDSFKRTHEPETKALSSSSNSNIPLSLATTAAPYIIQNGNIYQLTSNNTLISRSSIQLTNETNTNIIQLNIKQDGQQMQDQTQSFNQDLLSTTNQDNTFSNFLPSRNVLNMNKNIKLTSVKNGSILNLNTNTNKNRIIYKTPTVSNQLTDQLNAQIKTINLNQSPQLKAKQVILPSNGQNIKQTSNQPIIVLTPSNVIQQSKQYPTPPVIKNNEKPFQASVINCCKSNLNNANKNDFLQTLNVSQRSALDSNMPDSEVCITKNRHNTIKGSNLNLKQKNACVSLNSIHSVSSGQTVQFYLANSNIKNDANNFNSRKVEPQNSSESKSNNVITNIKTCDTYSFQDLKKEYSNQNNINNDKKPPQNKASKQINKQTVSNSLSETNKYSDTNSDKKKYNCEDFIENKFPDDLLNELLPDTRIFASLLSKGHGSNANNGSNKKGIKELRILFYESYFIII